MNKLRMSASLVALLLVAGLVPAGHAIDPIPMTPLVDVSLGFPYEENFDEDDGDWTASPVSPYARPDPSSTWEWGAPTSGPGAAFSGNNVWATNLDGNYDPSECGAILSPPIDLSGAAAASVSFMQWRHLDQSAFGSKFVNDPGRLFVTTDGGVTFSQVDPDQGNDGPMTSTTSIRRCFDNSPSGTQAIGGPPGAAAPGPAYSLMSADLTVFANQVVQFAIAFASGSSTHRAGWYIDDFNVTIDSVSTVEDFESGDGGFTVVSTADATPAPEGWDWSNVSAGPSVTSALWGTNTDGNYGHRECAWIESPPIDLGPAPSLAAGVVTARLAWNQWYRSNSVYAAGIVQVGVEGENGTTYQYVTPEADYPGQATGTYQDQLHACLGAESAEGAFSGTHDAVGNELKGQGVDLTPFVGEVITIRFVFASAWSLLGPTLYPGWYIDDVEVEMRAQVLGPDAEAIAQQLLDQVSPEGAQRPGWTTGGTDSSWAWGFAGDGGPEGELVYATGLNTTHNDSECSWIESPPIPTAGLALGADLVLDHWWHQYYSTFSGSAWNGGAVLASTDDGATWSYVPSDAYTNPAPFSGLNNCLRSIDPDLPSGVTVFGGEHEAFETSTIDLSDFTDGPTLRLRFVQASGITIERPGWYIRAATLGGVPVI